MIYLSDQMFLETEQGTGFSRTVHEPFPCDDAGTCRSLILKWLKALDRFGPFSPEW